MHEALVTMVKLNVVATSYADGVWSYTVKNSNNERFVMNVNTRNSTVYCANLADFISSEISSSSSAALVSRRTSFAADDYETAEYGDLDDGDDYVKPAETDDYTDFVNLFGAGDQKMPVTMVGANTWCTPTTFELAKYGMKIYAGSDDAYIPLAALTAILTPSADAFVWNGDRIIRRNFDTNDMKDDFAEWRKTDTRPEEFIDFTYNILCFNHDYCYGQPGYYGIFDIDGDGYNLGDEATGTKAADKLDLDSLLKKYAPSVYTNLHSSSYNTYVTALATLMNYILGDGHTGMFVPKKPEGTTINLPNEDKLPSSGKRKLLNKASDGLETKTNDTYIPKRDAIIENLPENRRFVLDGCNYKKDANKTPVRFVSFSEDYTTAVIHFNSFAIPNIQAWNVEYPKWTAYNSADDAGKAAIDADEAKKPSYPNDDLGLFYYAFNLIETNTLVKDKVQNIVIDLSVNGGGSVADVGYLLSFLYGDIMLIDQDAHTGANVLTSYSTDLNLDGTVDEKDDTLRKNRNTKYKMAILTSESSFSSANLFPVMAKEVCGAKIIGRRSSGGSCSINTFCTPDGFTYYYSIALRGTPDMLTEDRYMAMENGAAVDATLDYTTSGVNDFYSYAKLKEAVEAVYKTTN